MSDHSDLPDGELENQGFSDESDQYALSDDEATDNIIKGLRRKWRLKGDSPASNVPTTDEDPENLRTYRWRNGQVLKVGPTTPVKSSSLPICQICHHLNPEFMDCDQNAHDNGPWAVLEFKNTENARSCTHKIDNGQMITLTATSTHCLTCSLICTALSWERPGWESEQSIIEMYLAWGLPITLTLRYGTINRGPIASGAAALNLLAPEVDSGRNAHFEISIGLPNQKNQLDIIEIHHRLQSFLPDGSVPFLGSLGVAPERPK